MQKKKIVLSGTWSMGYCPLEDGVYSVSITADTFVWMLHLSEPDGVCYDENDFDLWPGETKTVIARTLAAEFQPAYSWIREA